MGLLRLAVLGYPEAFHDSSRLTFSLRKALALLIYLAVERGMYPRSKLAAFLWPDSEPHDARTALRNALALLRSLLADPDAAPAQHAHILSQHDLLALDPQAPLELDLDVVQQAYQQAQLFSTVPPLEQRTSLVAKFQHALSLVRGPFLDGFWLREEAPFDEWHVQQQHQWQMRLQLIAEQLSAWQEEAGELEQAQTTLIRWLALNPLEEEAYRRLMRVRLAQGDATAALQVYAVGRARLAEALQVKPSAETVALAARIRAFRARNPGSSSITTMVSRPPSELVAPFVGRQVAFSQLVAGYQQARQEQPQAVLLVGEAGIGKTRLAREFVAWAQAQGAGVLSGHAFETGGRLPYQPLVEALRRRLEAENAPEDLLEDLWLSELSRLLPELRVRYPDLPTPSYDELTTRIRLYEAVARLVDALAQRAPLVVLLDDLHWIDGASLDLLRYLAHDWKEHGSRVLLLGTVRSEGLELNPQFAAELADLGRDLPVSQVSLQTLSQAETIHLVRAITGEGAPGTALPSAPGASSSQEAKKSLIGLGDFLFAHTGGQPFYLLETLELLRDRQWLVPRLGVDGTWRLVPTVEMAAAVAQEQSRRALLPPSVRAMILARLSKLSQAARQLVMAGAVLGTQATAKLLWQVAEVGVQTGVEALEEAVDSGILREEDAGAGRPGSYYFAHQLMREVVYTELGEARRYFLHRRALALLETEGAKASVLAYHARACGEARTAYRYSVQAGDEAMTVFAVHDAIAHYEQARSLLQAHQLLQTVLEAPEVGHLYAYLGRAYANQNALQPAQEAYEELLAYAQHQHEPRLVSMTLNRLAVLAVLQSKGKPEVQSLLDEARQIAESSHDQRALAETEWNLAQIAGVMWEDPTSALPYGEQALSLARGIHDQELEARSLCSLGLIHLLGGDFEEAMHAPKASLALYAALGDEPTAARELSLPSLAIGAPLTQHLTNRAAEALCWGELAIAQVHCGQVQHSIRSGHRALALSKEIKNVWVQVTSTICLTHGLLDAGAYEEALVLTQQTIPLAQSFPLMEQSLLIALGRTYQALQQWEEARRSLEEEEAVAEMLDLGPLRVPALSQLCMDCALAGEWEAAYRYAMKAISVREKHDVALIALDFYRHYETEALLCAGDERRAREEVQQLEEGLGPNRRFRLPYLRSLAVLATWHGRREQAIGNLREAAGLAADLSLPGEQWQIQAALGTLYKAGSEPAQARTAFSEAARIIQGLAEGIGDESLRRRFLAGTQIHQVMQHAHDSANPVPTGAINRPLRAQSAR
jgi:predicted ATPase/DNA-binding SARP family transcriptional activator